MHEEERVGTETPVTVELLLASPRARYVGRPADGPEPSSGRETHDRVEIRAGLGVVGDRYFGRPAHRQASVTVFAAESLETVARLLGSGPLDAAATRRNVVLRGTDVDALRGETFSLDTGRARWCSGPIVRPTRAPGWTSCWRPARSARSGGGRVRCEPLTSGALSLGPAVLRVRSADSAEPVAGV
nr:hypothetical protein GCM10025699_45230 [Microbacterium flavescens]